VAEEIDESPMKEESAVEDSVRSEQEINGVEEEEESSEGESDDYQLEEIETVNSDLREEKDLTLTIPDLEPEDLGEDIESEARDLEEDSDYEVS
jgi:hypothetical protein